MRKIIFFSGLIFIFICLVFFSVLVINGLSKHNGEFQPVRASVNPDRNTIRTLIYYAEGASEPMEFLRDLRLCNKYNLVKNYYFDAWIKQFTQEDKLDLSDLAGADVLLIPGGTPILMDKFWVKEDVRDWIHQGGGYVGICAGEILAIEGKVDDPFFGSYEGLEIAPNIERINTRWIGARNIRFNEAGSRILGFSGDQRMMVWNGSAFRFKSWSDTGTIYARYYCTNLDNHYRYLVEDDSRYWGCPWNNDLEGWAAIISDYFGRGRIVLSGPHPEWSKMNMRFIKPRLIGTLVKLAYGDDSALPVVIGREDKLPRDYPVFSLTGMSQHVSVDAFLSSVSVFVRDGYGVGVMGIYKYNEKNQSYSLLSVALPFQVGMNNMWYKINLLNGLHVKRGDRILLAVLFDRPVAIGFDEPLHKGDLGETELLVSSFTWKNLIFSGVPEEFPTDGIVYQKIITLFAQ